MKFFYLALIGVWIIIIYLFVISLSGCGGIDLVREVPVEEVTVGVSPQGDTEVETSTEVTDKSIAVSIPLTISESSFLSTVAYIVGGVVLFLLVLVIVFASLWQRNSRSGRHKRKKKNESTDSL